jgi:glycyl-tRNA synthetase
MSTVNKTTHTFDKTRLDALLNRRFFYAPAFEIYGGACAIASIVHPTHLE